jgi:hypothetical protein
MTAITPHSRTYLSFWCSEAADLGKTGGGYVFAGQVIGCLWPLRNVARVAGNAVADARDERRGEEGGGSGCFRADWNEDISKLAEGDFAEWMCWYGILWAGRTVWMCVCTLGSGEREVVDRQVALG